MSMKKAVLVMLVVLMLAGLSLEAQEKPRLGVLRFTNETRIEWWTVSVAREMQDMMASELASTGEFAVLERNELGEVLAEQDLSESGRVDPASAVKVGKVKGAQYLIAGTVTSFEKGVSGGGGKVRFKGLSLGGQKDKAYIAVDVKVIDTETGEIVDTRTIEATVTAKGAGAGLSLRNFSIGGDAYKKTATGKAIRACIVYISEYLTCSLVKGKDHSCMNKWDKMDAKRREKTKSTIKLD